MPTRIYHPFQEVIVVIKILGTLILDDHVVQYHTSCHDPPKRFHIPKPCRFTNNGKLRLQNSKCSLHILPSNRLSIMKPRFFHTLRVMNWLEKCCTPWVYPICKIVFLCALVPILLKLKLWHFFIG